MNVIILAADEVARSGEVRLTGTRGRHLTRVLKVKPGQEVRIGFIDGPMGTGIVTAAGDDAVALQCTFRDTIPPRPRVDLLLALPRPKVMRRLWSQLAAMGVGQIMLTDAERVERDYFGTHVLAPDTYRPLLIEGLQQARDTRLPLVSIHRRFRPLVEDHLDGLFRDGVRVLADPGASRSIGTAIAGVANDRVLLAVGPEGGWNDFERRLLEQHGFQTVAMGPRTLRTDTACIALLALAHDALSRA
jgi:RsmE family RNA methyltransferase